MNVVLHWMFFLGCDFSAISYTNTWLKLFTYETTYGCNVEWQSEKLYVRRRCDMCFACYWSAVGKKLTLLLFIGYVGACSSCLLWFACGYLRFSSKFCINFTKHSRSKSTNTTTTREWSWYNNWHWASA